MVWLVLLLFSIAVAGTAFALVSYNRGFSSLEHGGIVPETKGMFYVDEYEIGANAITFDLVTTKGQRDTLCLVLTGLSACSVRVDNAVVFAWDHEDLYEYSRVIPISCPAGEHMVELSFRIPKTKNPLYLLTERNYRPSLLVGDRETALGYQSKAQYTMCVMIGVFAMMLIGCVALFAGKRTERYLMVLVSGLLVVSARTLFVFAPSVLRLTESGVIVTRNLLTYLPVTINAIVCGALFCGGMEKKRRYLLSIGIPCFLNALDIVLSYAVPFSMYQFFRRLMWIPMLIMFVWAVSHGKWRAIPALIAYGVSEGLLIYVHVVKELYILPHDPVLMFSRLSEIGHLLFMLVCTVSVYIHYGIRFGDADRYAIELKEANEHLEEKVAERTRKIAELENQRKQMMLNTFHDLRSPLFVLKQRIEQMNAEEVPSEETVRVLNERIRYLSRLSEDVFLAAKLENNDVIYDESTVELSRIILDMVSAAAVDAAGKRIDLSETVEPSLQTWGDTYRIQQALQNLMDNALKYTPDGGCIRIHAGKDGNMSVIRFWNSGAGIAEDKLPYVFKRYYTAGTHMKNSTGLGLSIAREIIRAHGGSIEVSSRVGEWTEFRVRLPEI